VAIGADVYLAAPFQLKSYGVALVAILMTPVD